MNLSEYAALDATALAALVDKGEVTASELAALAKAGIDALNPALNAVVETYPDRIGDLDEATLGSGPFRGVPFLMKDTGFHEAGRKRELGSRLCEGLVCTEPSNFTTLVQASGVNILGRTNVPEFCLAGTTENVLYGDTSTPWRQGYSAGGSSGGSAAAVAAGIVPLAHGSDIGGSIRIPASYCGGVGMKPSRARISYGPQLDEGGFGMAQNMVQTRSVRDSAALLDCVSSPMPGDPFVIRQPARPYIQEIGAPVARLRIGFSSEPLAPSPVDGPVAAAVEAIAALLADMGHAVEEAAPLYDFDAMTGAFLDTWFFGFARTIDGYAALTGRAVGPATLEPQTLGLYEASKALDPYDFLMAQGTFNGFRRDFGAFFDDYDIWLTPSTAKMPEPHGLYHQGCEGEAVRDYMERIDYPVQFSVPYNISGCPAISLPLAMSDDGLPIGIQIGARHGAEDLLFRLAAALEDALPWADRIPPTHVSRI